MKRPHTSHSEGRPRKAPRLKHIEEACPNVVAAGIKDKLIPPLPAIKDVKPTSDQFSLREGDVVVLYGGYEDVHQIVLKKGEKFTCRLGAFGHSSIIDKMTFGSIIRDSKTEKWMMVTRPTPEAHSLTLQHRTQIVYTKDAALCCQLLNLKDGARVVESGTGSCSMTHFMSRLTGSGTIFTFEYHDERVKQVAKDLDSLKLSNVKLYHRDVYKKGFLVGRGDEFRLSGDDGCRKDDGRGVEGVDGGVEEVSEMEEGVGAVEEEEEEGEGKEKVEALRNADVIIPTDASTDDQRPVARAENLPVARAENLPVARAENLPVARAENLPVAHIQADEGAVPVATKEDDTTSNAAVTEGSIDAVFLDLPQPWRALDHANLVLKEGVGNLVIFSPCVEQVQKSIDWLEAHFWDHNTYETMTTTTKYRVYGSGRMTFREDRAGKHESGLTEVQYLKSRKVCPTVRYGSIIKLRRDIPAEYVWPTEMPSIGHSSFLVHAVKPVDDDEVEENDVEEEGGE